MAGAMMDRSSPTVFKFSEQFWKYFSSKREQGVGVSSSFSPRKGSGSAIEGEVISDSDASVREIEIVHVSGVSKVLRGKIV